MPSRFLPFQKSCVCEKNDAGNCLIEDKHIPVFINLVSLSVVSYIT